jgi:effector-binding domain-containing protein
MRTAGQIPLLKIWIDTIKTEGAPKMTSYQVVLKKTEAVTVASIRDTLHDFAKQEPIWGELISHLQLHRVKAVEPTAVYLDPEVEAEGTNFEAAEIITRDIPETNRIKIRQWEPVPLMACVIHEGSHEHLADAYTAIQQWMEQNGYRTDGPVREVHLIGYLSGAELEDHRTEIQIPVIKGE